MDVIGYTKFGMIEVKLFGNTMFVPDDPRNVDRQRISEWEAEGNVIPPYQEPLPTINDYRVAIQNVITEAAKSRRYDDGNSLASYVSSTNPTWSAEAEAFVAWRDEVWIYAYSELAKVEAEEREQPSIAEFLQELPVIHWPAA